MIKIEKKVSLGFEADYEKAIKDQSELEANKNAEKVAICESMKEVDAKDVLEAFTAAIKELDAKYERKAHFYSLIIEECLENVEVEYPDEEEVIDLDEETEVVE